MATAAWWDRHHHHGMLPSALASHADVHVAHADRHTAMRSSAGDRTLGGRAMHPPDIYLILQQAAAAKTQFKHELQSWSEQG